MIIVQIVNWKNNLKDLKEDLIAKQHQEKEIIANTKERSRSLVMKEHHIQVASIKFTKTIV